MNIDMDKLPEGEQVIFRAISQLKRSEKEVLWKVIQGADKEQISTYHEINNTIRRLEATNLISINTNYSGSEYSFIVLSQAPNLFGRLKKLSIRQSGFLNKLRGYRVLRLSN
ncbi:hypothetical protein ACERII_24595 [Evansella sp. AB-rgal1]|uniref:hypothetical protein n=1 Tax=Evansella sp. AB-rgal1 TaxID=3242696 RepID=UPI00359E34C0